MKKAQLKELIKQSMSEFNDPDYLDLMKKADDTGRGYAERDEFRNQAWDLKRAKLGAMTPDEERMVSDYEEEEANKYALDSENPLEETGELRRGSVILNHDEIYAKYSSLFKKYTEAGMRRVDAISQAHEDLAKEYGTTFSNISSSIDDYWKEQYMMDDENPLEEAKSTSVTDYKVGDILSFKDGEDWKVMKVKDKVDKLVIKPHNEKAKEGNVSLEIDIDSNYLKKHLKTESLKEVIKKTDMILESWTKKKILKEADLSQANFNDLHQVVKNIAHVNEIGMEEAAMQAIEYIAEQFDVPVDFRDF